MVNDASRHDPDDIEIPIHKIRRKHSNESTKDEDECSVPEKKTKFVDEVAMTTTTVSANSSDEPSSFAQERVTLEALENTKVAVAQFAAIALAKGADENAIKDLSLLQSTLFTLQHQQVVQLQLIQKLQSQLESTNKKAKSTKRPSSMKSIDSAKELENRKGVNVTSTPPPPPPPPPVSTAKTVAAEVEPVKQVQPSQNGFLIKTNEKSNEMAVEHEKIERVDEVKRRVVSPMCRISPSLASTIITNHDGEQPLPSEASSLQMLQKRAEEVLDSATQSFVAGNLIDELAYRTGDDFNGSKNVDDATTKHRCRYCGKIFGSYSALQIHLRSHTGERPFKCNMCPSSFTTKGNLKVHYQRHTESGLSFEAMDANRSFFTPADSRNSSESAPVKDFRFFDAEKEATDLRKLTAKPAKKPRSEVKSPMPTNDEPIALLSDPAAAVEQLLLPKNIRSHKKAWESFIEITNTPKATELQSISDEQNGSESNKCPICHRILSCRSALRQHYRTHTGERPFKCRLCGRAFTTKGNLKTHISVHKLKPFLTSLHKCPICHRQYSNAMVLQQHINTHTGEPIEMTFDQIRASEVRDFVPLPRQNESFGSHGSSSCDYENSIDSESRRQSIDQMDDERKSQTNASDAEDMRHERSVDDENDDTVSDQHKASPTEFRDENRPQAFEASEFVPKFPPLFAASLSGARPPPLHHLLGNNFNSMLPSSPFSSMSLPGIRGNTTCNICYKTFACHSALEIHYRSHTKERPYKCTICDRGFSTKGNMKQHMLTHKIRDMPPHVFGNSMQTVSASADSYNSPPPPPLPVSSSSSSLLTTAGAAMTTQDTDTFSETHDKHSDDESRGDGRNHKFVSVNESISRTPTPVTNLTQSPHTIDSILETDRIKEEEHDADNDMHHEQSPIASQNNESTQQQQCDDEVLEDERVESGTPDGSDATGNSKLLCKICKKYFSSSSSVQIHMRTHTGDKPFTCNICQKSFSTKGNLKVHMGTHMWTNASARRGRRMSFEMPPNFPPPPNHFLHARPEMFHPYINSAAMFQQKFHEINALQKYSNLPHIREFLQAQNGPAPSNGMVNLPPYQSYESALK